MEAVGDPERSLHEVLGVAHRAISPFEGDAADPGLAEIDDLLRTLGWEVSADAPDRHGLARALAGLRALGHEVDATALLPYAEAVEPLAEREIAGMPTDGSREGVVEYAVVGTVVFGQALTALRRLAQEHHSAVVDRAGAVAQSMDS